MKLKHLPILLFAACTALFILSYAYAAITALWIGTVASNPGNQTVNEPYPTNAYTWFWYNTDGNGYFDWWVKHKVQKHWFLWWWTDAGSGIAASGNHTYIGPPITDAYLYVFSTYNFTHAEADKYRFRSEAHSESTIYPNQADKNADWQEYYIY